MKVLVLSLLRVGDFIMHESVISAIQEQFPQAELHLLINDTSEKYVRSNKKYSHVHVLPRTRLQQFLVEADRPKLAAHFELSTFIDHLNNLNFDSVVNLSHTMFSARLMDLLRKSSPSQMTSMAPMQKSGMRFQDGHVVPPENTWLQYMNENFSRHFSTPFQTGDLLARAIGLGIKPLPLSHRKKGTEEFQNISLQVLTSDAKKNWPQKNFVELSALILARFPNSKLTVLGSPEEEALLRQNFETRPGLKIEILNWRDLRHHLESTNLLISGDTSVQHLAAQVGTPLLSLFLGSANPEKTAPLQPGAILLQPRTACAPCSHMGQCHQPSHVCAEDLSVENVFSVVESMLLKKPLPEIQAQIFTMHKKNDGIFFLKRLGQGAEVINLKRSLEQVVWQIYLDQGHLDVAGPFGSAAYILIDEYAQYLRQSEIHHWLQKRMQEFQSHEIFIDHFELNFRQRISPFLAVDSSSDLSILPRQLLRDEIINHLFGKSSGKDYFFSLLQTLNEAEAGFPQMKKVKGSIEEARALVEIELKLIKAIMTELKERNFVYVSGTRTLSDTRAATP